VDYDYFSMSLGITEIVLLVFVIGFPVILIIYCLLDITRSSFRDPTNKIIWAIIVLLAPVLGSLAYLIWGRNQKTTTT
jgi:drug/metabolite transporter (DMT)-like permease